jgi:hypothetical protein
VSNYEASVFIPLFDSSDFTLWIFYLRFRADSVTMFSELVKDVRESIR